MGNLLVYFDLIRRIREYKYSVSETVTHLYSIPESLMINITEVFNCASTSLILVERNGRFISRNFKGNKQRTLKTFNSLY